MCKVSFKLYPTQYPFFKKWTNIPFFKIFDRNSFLDATTIVSSESIEGASEDGIPFNPRPASPYWWGHKLFHKKWRFWFNINHARVIFSPKSFGAYWPFLVISCKRVNFSYFGHFMMILNQKRTIVILYKKRYDRSNGTIGMGNARFRFQWTSSWFSSKS